MEITGRSWSKRVRKGKEGRGEKSAKKKKNVGRILMRIKGWWKERTIAQTQIGKRRSGYGKG